MKINWKVRFSNKLFWLTIVPATILLIQTAAAVFGFTLDLGELGNKLVDVINAAFGVMAVLGVVTDPTTAGASDSTQALTYDKPKESE